MDYGMPSYSRAGEVEVAFASQKQYISLYMLRTDVMAAHRAQLDHLSVGKGAIRFRKPEDIDLSTYFAISNIRSSQAYRPAPLRARGQGDWAAGLERQPPRC
jgi:uncharacterized protein YdhG (YjbR/CyaY superfamily)